MSVSLSFDGFNPGFISSLARNPGVQRLRRRSFFTQNRLPDTRAPVICTACPLRWRSAASDPDSASRARRLRRRIYYLARSESCASVRELRIRILSGCVRGFSMPKISYIDNQAPVICTTCPLRWRLTQKQDYKHPQMCFLLLLLPRACTPGKSVVKSYLLPTQCVENIAGGFA